MAPRGSPEDPKVTALRESRCLNPHPEQVTDEAFLADHSFEPGEARDQKNHDQHQVTPGQPR